MQKAPFSWGRVPSSKQRSQLMALADKEGSLPEGRGPRRALSLSGLSLCHLGLVTWWGLLTSSQSVSWKEGTSTCSTGAATAQQKDDFQIALEAKVRTLMTEKTICLKRIGAEHIPSTALSLGRPQAVVPRWGKFHFSLGGLGELGP